MRVAQSPAASPQKWGSGENGRLHLHYTLQTHTKSSSKTVVSAPVVGAQSPKNRPAIARKGDCGRRRAGFRKKYQSFNKSFAVDFQFRRHRMQRKTAISADAIERPGGGILAEPEGTRKNGFHLPTRDARLEAREKEIFHECETQRYSIVEPRMRKPRRD